jgi:alkylhydroperoxidase/carboxymuconolactone decarboxylase family protein YurZ
MDFPNTYECLLAQMNKLGGQLPNVMKGFSQLHHASAADGVLSAKMKELIALSIATWCGARVYRLPCA